MPVFKTFPVTAGGGMSYVPKFKRRECPGGDCPGKCPTPKYWHDLEIYVRGHAELCNLVPFETLGTVSYSHS